MYPWFDQTLTCVNDAVVRLGVLEGDFHWHVMHCTHAPVRTSVIMVEAAGVVPTGDD
jgi:hypothetical protein